VTVPNAARMYDYSLGGYHNFAVDREFVDRAEKLMPGASWGSHANRAFVGRSVRWLVEVGIRQFLDIGSGIPTLGNVHQIAQQAAPESRVLYVDIDPVAVAHSRALLAGNPRAEVIQGDVRAAAEIVYHPDVVRLLDFSRPVAVLLNAVLHFVPDADDPADLVAQLCESLVSGSYLTITHATPIPALSAEQDDLRALYESTPTSLHYRTKDQVVAMLAGFELVEPGLVNVTDWRPDPDEADDPPPAAVPIAAVARKI